MSLKKIVFLITFVIIITASYGTTTPLIFNRQFDSSELESRGQLIQLKYDREKGEIKLDDRVLIEDDAPGNGPPEGVEDRAWFEKLHRGVLIKKEIVLDDPRAYNVYIVMNGVEVEQNEHPLHISVNGKEFTRLPSKYAYPLSEHYYIIGKHNYFTDNWFIIEFPVGALRTGTNEILLWADSEETSWEVKVAAEQEFKRGSTTRIHHPNRSSKSMNGGKTWDYSLLGWKDEIDGEYAIRVSLDRYATAGTYISPVIDITDTNSAGIKKMTEITGSKLLWDIECPEGTKACISYRTGESPICNAAEQWTDFLPVSDYEVTIANPRGRYLQFRVEMTTENPLLSPKIKGLNIYTDGETITPESNISCHITEFRNGQVINPSVEFVHEDFKKLSDFRKRFELDKLLAGTSTEFEKQIKLLRFAYQIPIKPMEGYVWDFNALPILKKDEKNNIIFQTDYTGRRRDLHCLMSNFTLMGACLAMGYPARYVNLQTEGRSHAHEVVEVWSNDFNKWIYMDATRDFYIYDPDTGIPLSLTEVNERLREIVPHGVADWYDPIWMQIPDETEAYKVNVEYREGDNKYSIRDVTQGPHILFLMGQLHMVIRNDFASRPWLVPWRIASGHWGGNQFYGYYNETFPRKREYMLNTNRWQDFNFPLNQTELTLSETEIPGILQVEMDTVTPNFETFEIQIDNTNVIESAHFSFEWHLHEGKNTLEVRARNNVGVKGPTSRVVILVNN